MITKPNKNTSSAASIKKYEKESTLEWKHLDKIGEIPLAYGFIPHATPTVTKEDIKTSEEFAEGDYIGTTEQDEIKLPLHVEEKVALLRMYDEKDMYNQPQPVMMYFSEPIKTTTDQSQHKMGKKGSYPRYADLEIIGSTRSVAEATLIQTARIMLKEEGFNNIGVEINSVGDKDSLARFTRELNSYYRKHINTMTPEARQLFKRDPFELVTSTLPTCKEINSLAPKSMSFLSEASRNHFREVLEFLETLDIPYKINNGLIGNRKYCSETIFEIVDLDYDPKKSKHYRTLAVGVRYDGLSKKVGTKKDVPGVGLSLLIKGTDASLRKPLTKTKKPWVYFIQLGFEAKLLSLHVIEILRKAKVPLYQSLPKDKLGAQVLHAEKLDLPYTIIMGKKEAVEKAVLVRNSTTRAQEPVLFDNLANYMKKLGETLRNN